MGCDPKAILYYGIKLGSEPEWPEDGGVDYHTVNDDWQKMKGPKRPEDHGNYRTPEWDEWRAKLKVYEASPLSVKIDWSGTDECHDGGWYVHCDGLERCVEWDDHLNLAGFELGRNAEADAALKEFCEAFCLIWKQPSWHLACQYF